MMSGDLEVLCAGIQALHIQTSCVSLHERFKILKPTLKFFLFLAVPHGEWALSFSTSV